MKLNLGCEDKILSGFENIDIVKRDGVKVVNLNKYPLPWKNDSVDYVLCSHLLEHLDDPVKFMLELYRICKKDAVIDIRVPHVSMAMNHADLTHKRYFSYFTFGDKNWNKMLYDKFEVKRKLNFTRTRFTLMNVFVNPLINLFPSVYERFFCYMLPCSEVLFKLRVVK